MSTMKDEKDSKDDLIVDIPEDQLALPMEDKEEVLVEEAKVETKTEEVKVDPVEKRERKRPNEDAIKALQAQLDEANRRSEAAEMARAKAEERAREREAEAEAAKGRVAQSEYDRIQGLIAAAKSRESDLKRAIRSASEMGEHDKLAEYQAELAKTAARQLQYEDAKLDLEHRAERAKQDRDAAPVRVAPKTNADPFEARISNLSQKSQSWLRQHPECVNDPAKNDRLMKGHHLALGKGIQPDSQEYFEHLESHMGYRDDEDDDGGEEIETDTRSGRKSVPSAPVSRDSRMGQVAPGKYRLSREEADMAEQMGMTPTEYATYKIKGLKEGRWAN